jgi:hypothetical protein
MFFAQPLFDVQNTFRNINYGGVSRYFKASFETLVVGSASNFKALKVPVGERTGHI